MAPRDRQECPQPRPLPPPFHSQFVTPTFVFELPDGGAKKLTFPEEFGAIILTAQWLIMVERDRCKADGVTEMGGAISRPKSK